MDFHYKVLPSLTSRTLMVVPICGENTYLGLVAEVKRARRNRKNLVPAASTQWTSAWQFKVNILPFLIFLHKKYIFYKL